MKTAFLLTIFAVLGVVTPLEYPDSITSLSKGFWKMTKQLKNATGNQLIKIMRNGFGDEWYLHEDDETATFDDGTGRRRLDGFPLDQTYCQYAVAQPFDGMDKEEMKGGTRNLSGIRDEGALTSLVDSVFEVFDSNADGFMSWEEFFRFSNSGWNGTPFNPVQAYLWCASNYSDGWTEDDLHKFCKFYFIDPNSPYVTECMKPKFFADMNNKGKKDKFLVYSEMENVSNAVQSFLSGPARDYYTNKKEMVVAANEGGFINRPGCVDPAEVALVITLIVGIIENCGCFGCLCKKAWVDNLPEHISTGETILEIAKCGPCRTTYKFFCKKEGHKKVGGCCGCGGKWITDAEYEQMLQDKKNKKAGKKAQTVVVQQQVAPQQMQQQQMYQQQPGQMQQQQMMPGQPMQMQPGMQQMQMQPGMQPMMQMQPGMQQMQPGMQPMMMQQQPGMQPMMMQQMQPGMQAQPMGTQMYPGMQPMQQQQQ